MTEKPTPEETAIWQRRLAGQANNRAWALTEAASRTPAQDQEMLHAAHAAMHFWGIVGNESQRSHAAQLLAHVHALLGLAGSATRYLAASQPVFLSGTAQPWEVALAHAVAANVAAANHDAVAHTSHYETAHSLTAQLPDPEDRKVLEATLNILPKPRS